MRPALPLLALALAGCLSAPAPGAPAGLAAPPAAAPAAEALAFTNQTGTLVALPVAGGAWVVEHEVPEGTDWLAAVLKWETRGTVLTLEALDPSGEARGEQRTLAGSGPRSPARLDWWSPAPAPGTWTFTVRGQAALLEPLRLQLHTARGHADGMHMAEALRVPEGRFAEVNMELARGAVARFAWRAAEPVHFDVHTHRGGETQYLVDETAAAGQGEVVADEDGLYSLLWAFGEALPAPPPGGRAVDLAYTIEGGWALHSAVG